MQTYPCSFILVNNDFRRIILSRFLWQAVTWYRKIQAETVFASLYSSQGNHVCYYLNKQTIKISLSTSKSFKTIKFRNKPQCLLFGYYKKLINQFDENSFRVDSGVKTLFLTSTSDFYCITSLKWLHSLFQQLKHYLYFQWFFISQFKGAKIHWFGEVSCFLI